MHLNKLEMVSKLSHQDYGPWCDQATLYQDGTGKLILFVEGGYSKPYEEEWYELSGKPSSPLEELLGDSELWSGNGEASVLEDLLDVTCTPIPDPTKDD